MSIKKQYLKKKPVCKVTLRVPKEMAPEASQVFVVGEFNDWDKDSTPMQRLKSGDFKTVLELDTGREYQFRYLIDNEQWENDPEADRLVDNNFSFDKNSVVVV